MSDTNNYLAVEVQFKCGGRVTRFEQHLQIMEQTPTRIDVRGSLAFDLPEDIHLVANNTKSIERTIRRLLVQYEEMELKVNFEWK